MKVRQGLMSCFRISQLYHYYLIMRILPAICFFLILLQLHGQGCSDAGFCTMGAMKPDQSFGQRLNIKLRSIELAQYIGLTRFGDVIYNTYADVNIGIADRNTLQLKMPYAFIDGVLDDTQGWGDLTVSITRNIVQNRRYQVNFTIGTKIPTGKTDLKTSEGRTLPMYNQPGLGTTDFVAGISLINQNWLFATGYQQAFGELPNSFLWQGWEGHPLEEEAFAYPQSRGIKRGRDIMFRVERNFRWTNWNVNIGLLPIYRLNPDVINIPIVSQDENDNRVFEGFSEREMENSDGLALTLLLGGGYQFNVRSGIKIMQGLRLVQRERNPDGLSRKLVTNIGYIFRF
jgi:hypothetical protein